jgi:hypothetical protein
LSLILVYRTKIVYTNLYGKPRTWKISSQGLEGMLYFQSYEDILQFWI